ncbi:MAG: PIN domain-containing protein [Acidobacteria bacterium]|nr:PIN domain-containing protein [Acidobacteriota bacterium]
MDMDVEARRPRVCETAAALILLDTNAIIWLLGGGSRAATLTARGARLYASPASMLELQLLSESGRLRVRGGASVAQLMHDERWVLDDPSSAAWFEKAIAVGWTRDPFDRLLVAHARLRKWRLATGDGALIARLDPKEVLEL